MVKETEEVQKCREVEFQKLKMKKLQEAQTDFQTGSKTMLTQKMRRKRGVG